MSLADGTDAVGTERGTRNSRNPRRRARPDSESIKVAPRRKRSKITETTFLSREDANDDANDSEPMNGQPTHQPAHTNGTRQPSSSSTNGAHDMPLRSRSGAKRLPRIDPATVLTQNENYSIRLLANTPRDLKRRDVEFRGSIDAHSGLALAITHERAYIWDHTGHGTISSTKTVEVPADLASHGVLPLGCLVAAAPGGDLGVLLVSAHAGKVVYHESIDRVTSQSFFSERKDGVTGSVQGLFSGEHVTQLVSAHPAGFVAVLNSGRLVHLTLRDSQGRPRIRTQLLAASEQGGGGIFGSLKNILGSQSWRQAVSAIRTRGLERGQVQVLALLEKGELRVWNVDWSGHHEYQYSVSIRDLLQDELRQMQPAESQSGIEQVTVLDFAVTERESTGQSGQPDRPISVIVLVQSGYSGRRSTYLAQLSIHQQGAQLRRMLTCHDIDDSTSDFHARLVIPTPFNTAFIVRSASITILSLLVAASDPEAQLHEASYIEPEPFQDTIFIQSQKSHILGADLDATRHNGDATSIVFAQGAGLLKIAVKEVPRELEPWQTIKSRLEQAIFFGSSEGNILDLLRHAGPNPNPTDLNNAALQLSHEIFTSSSSYLDTPPISIESSLTRKSDALHALAEILQKGHQPLPRASMWHLLVQAEKIAGASRLWSLFERSTIESKTKKIANLWQEIMQCIEDKHPFDSIYEHARTDDMVRTFFVTQLENLQAVLEFACRVTVLVAAKENGSTTETTIRIASEADNIWLDCLEAVFQFRTDNAALYGISPTKLEDGVVKQPADLQDVEELWTSSTSLFTQAPIMTTESRQIAVESYEADIDASMEQVAMKIAKENARLIEITCRMFRERITWCFSRATPKYDDQAEMLQQAYKETRYSEARALPGLGQTQDGLKIAEKYKDMNLLTEMLIGESQYLYDSLLGAPLAEREAINAELEKNNDRVNRYFELYGNEFSDAFFGHSFTSGTTGHMLSQAQTRWREPLTEYLRRDPSRGKVCWINDVLKEKDFKHAGRTLLDVATDQEQNVWSKTVELSLAKLSMFASQETDQVKEIDKELLFMGVQDRLYDHLYPATYHSLDAEAAVKDALISFAKNLQSYPLHLQLVGDLIAKVLDHKTLELQELIDVLTLTDVHAESREDKDISRSETLEALNALYASPTITSTSFDLLLKLIWKRALVQEDWAALNAIAAADGDAAAQDFIVQTNLYRAIYGILEAATAEEDKIQILTPEQTLGAGTSEGDLPSYVPQDVTEHLLEENMRMEHQLEDLIRSQRLNSWMSDIIRYAKDAVWAAAEEQAANARWAAQEEAQVNGHATNGYTNGIKTEDNEEILIDEANGDIMML